jgi:IS30 family transposase
MEIERLRRQRWTEARIAHQLGLSAATLGRVLRRLGLNRAGDLEPRPPPNRYEHPAAGDLHGSLNPQPPSAEQGTMTTTS